MKRTIRILFPIILAIAVCFCAVWYLFVYDREFTRDVLLTTARYCEGQGNQSVAAFFYKLAYSHSGDNDAVAIELADQHKSSGNYTKAEYTLSNAISDGGGVELYIALCKTYVEQDKLLDAVNMLNNITDPEIKKQVDAVRPAIPVSASKPGFYSQYISVELQSDNGTLYVTTDGEYPSTADAPYSGAIQLVEGENTIHALAVAENGLVSQLATFGYIIGGVIEEVQFADPVIESAIRSQLNIDAQTPVYTSNLWDITEFVVPTEATVYSDLKFLTYLESLSVENGVSSELLHISSLSTLKQLSIRNCTVTDELLKAIASLPMLTTLTLDNCGISNISALEAAKKLIYLDLRNNSVRNLTALSSMLDLQTLNLQHNAVADLTTLSSLKKLTWLDVSYNALSTISPISGIVSLTWLDASSNSITDMGNVNQLSNLAHLALAKNKIADVSKISFCTALTELDISNNALTDILCLEPLKNLMYFNFAYNQITALPAWSPDCALVTIDGTSNLLDNVNSLGGMKSLNNVYMDYNEELSSIDALANCPVLIKVNVYGTKVTEVDALTSQSVIVNYNPVQDTQ